MCSPCVKEGGVGLEGDAELCLGLSEDHTAPSLPPQKVIPPFFPRGQHKPPLYQRKICPRRFPEVTPGPAEPQVIPCLECKRKKISKAGKGGDESTQSISEHIGRFGKGLKN